MCPSSWKLYLDDFPYYGSSLARLETSQSYLKFGLFEVDAIGDDDDLSHAYLPNFKQWGDPLDEKKSALQYSTGSFHPKEDKVSHFRLEVILLEGNLLTQAS